jgi:hypothetical protein
VVQATLSTGRLKIAERLPFAEQLRTELINFRMKVTPAANEVFEARQGQHDDLVLAVAVALWLASVPSTHNYVLNPPEASVWDVDLDHPPEGFEAPPPLRTSRIDMDRMRGPKRFDFTSRGRLPPLRPPDGFGPSWPPWGTGRGT